MLEDFEKGIQVLLNPQEEATLNSYFRSISQYLRNTYKNCIVKTDSSDGTHIAGKVEDFTYVGVVTNKNRDIHVAKFHLSIRKQGKESKLFTLELKIYLNTIQVMQLAHKYVTVEDKIAEHIIDNVERNIKIIPKKIAETLYGQKKEE